jgi:predicted transcriptional regulator
VEDMILRINEQGHRGISEFEGYSAIEMESILYEPFEKNSPIQLLKMSEAEYNNVPILNQIKYFLKLIEREGELRLTAKGFLPRKIVFEIYNQKFLKEAEEGVGRIYRETDLIHVNLTRILSQLSGIVKKRNNKLSLTKKGKEELYDNHRLLKNILRTFGIKFNWAYHEGYGDNYVGQFGFGFSLILLSKYGNKKRLDSFYSDKYFRAFPMLLNDVQSTQYSTKMEVALASYSLRTFNRFLRYFGLIKIDSSKTLKTPKYVVKTELFDKLIKVIPPGQFG